mmetsp:Transcript_6915/g.13797  ORF Transcript_6915/g.13797 Transcript_6915/m.13797 type:complete len:484 (-) Transcript_6915:129-1580(-)|eukprot:CAMPEP_0171542122 /NCGR_PEP_ID=MMETSP0960-20121227/2168_1 /TAXON_ID=87120 /ORGANISM="Aurantiochytrium limacinum, Strain ATCCMYA-1381" /LENGTH=483 /DNA_ID=CAMNT_0012089581 /DNA_START=18 /DNA_END=1469 /DNA_ORIENTATION=+
MEPARPGLAGGVPSDAFKAEGPRQPIKYVTQSAESRLGLDENDGVLEVRSAQNLGQMLQHEEDSILDEVNPNPYRKSHGKNVFKQAMSLDGAIVNNKPGKLLCVKAIEARELVDRDHVSKNDPYVMIRVGENCSFSKVHREAGSEVVLNWEAKFPAHSMDAPGLLVSVIDHDTYTKDDLLGTCAPEPAVYKRATSINKSRGWYELTRFGTFTNRPKKGGVVLLEIWYEDYQWPDTVDDDVRRTLRNIQPFPIPKLRLVSNFNHRAGFLRTILDHSHFHTFNTYQLNLWEVNAVFDYSVCNWSETYRKGQRIYGPGLSCAMVRAGIRMQHRWLYSKNDSEGGYFHIYHVEGMEELFRVLDYGRVEGRSVRYTYVIMPDGIMHFSETSKKTGQDLLSKHALHANCSKEVIYAGEMFIDLHSERFHRTKLPALIIDNNSGTFAPTPSKLLNLRALLELNLGHRYPVFALDRDDERLKTWFEQNNLE